MLGRLFVKLCQITPFRRALWRAWYGYISRAHRVPELIFMNFGWTAADGAPLLGLEAADEPDRFCIQLYHHLTEGADLRGREVLEVGSGRGGGASFLARYHRPARMVGLDLSANAVEFCQWRHRVPNLEFVRGDAGDLPFSAAAFDVVINVESSHCYPSMPKFLAEVRRVLRPGGVFLYTDFRERGTLPSWRDGLQRSGLVMEREEDITARVLAALDADSARKRGLVERLAWRPLRKAFAQFAALQDTPIYDLFRAGELVYLAFRLRQPGPKPA